MKIVAWVSLSSQNRSLTKWFVMQCIKQGSTLRISPKKDKPCPRVVSSYGSLNHQVEEFLVSRRVVKGIMEKMQEKQKTETLQ